VDAKKTTVVLVLVSVLFFMLSAPADAAQLVRRTAEFAWNLMNGVGQSMQTFMTSLTQ